VKPGLTPEEAAAFVSGIDTAGTDDGFPVGTAVTVASPKSIFHGRAGTVERVEDFGRIHLRKVRFPKLANGAWFGAGELVAA
jgi:hypothetical protein